MANKATFNSEEWNLVRNTPHTVAMAMMTAGSSGLFGSISEAFTAGKTFVDSLQSPSEMIRALSTQEEMMAFKDWVTDAVKAKSPAEATEWLKSTALANAKAALATIERKTPEEVAEYKVFLVKVAEEVAASAKEGGFFGFGGERVSANEAAFLNELKTAIG